MVVSLHCERQQTDSARGWQAPTVQIAAMPVTAAPANLNPSLNLIQSRLGYWQSRCRLYYRQTFHVPRLTPDRHGWTSTGPPRPTGRDYFEWLKSLSVRFPSSRMATVVLCSSATMRSVCSGKTAPFMPTATTACTRADRPARG